jgi:ubiquinone/menaquinone biosynthesis C-methylase UbiE
MIGYDQKYEWDKIALKHMRQCERILDIGCGQGRFIGHSPKRISGVDHDQESLEFCKKKGYDVKYSKVTKLNFKDNSFDAVHCSHVIEHLAPEDAHKLLSEMNRVLKVGGVFCIRTPMLYDKFYCDLTHVKPYYPEAILHYIKTEKTAQTTLNDIDGLYKITKIKYRRSQLFSFLNSTSFWFIGVFFNVLYRFKISGFKKTGYMMILKKIK